MVDLLDELLADATVALRDRAGGEAPVEATRQRVMASYQPRSRPRRVGGWVLVFGLSSATLAWAAATGRVDAALERIGLARTEAVELPWPQARGVAPVAMAPAVVAPDEPKVAAIEPIAPTVVAPVEPKVAAIEPIAPALPVAPPTSSRPREGARKPPSHHPIAPTPTIADAPTPTVETAAPDLDLDAYRRAHSLHFHGGAAAATLAAWDAYLAQFADGRFAALARYNRALMLVRLERFAEARVALTPFADGAVDGGFRAREAKALLAALAGRP